MVVKKMVYIISDQSGFVKIGSTNNLKRRLGGGLQVGNPNQLCVVAEIYCDNYIQLEKALHKHFHKHRGIGEWFDKCVVDEFLNMTEIQIRNLVYNYDLGDILIKIDNTTVIFKNQHNKSQVDEKNQRMPKITNYWRCLKNGEHACGHCGISVSKNISIRFFDYCPHCGNYMKAV